MTAMSILKLSLLLFSSFAFHLGLGRASSLDKQDKVMVTTSLERIWRHVGVPSTIFLKAAAWLAVLSESIVIVSSLLGIPCPNFIRNVLGPVEASKLTTPSVLGASLVVLGGILRVTSFRALGPYFTFIQCIRKDHKLVTTGPYAVLRHPAYAGLLYCIIGWGMIHGSPGSWLRMSGVLKFMWSRIILVCSCLIMAACLVTVFRRSADEDRFLFLRFGAEWETWARRVKYRLVPFVY